MPTHQPDVHTVHIQTLVKVEKRGGEELECLCFTNLTKPPVKTLVFLSYNAHTNVSEILLQHMWLKLYCNQSGIHLLYQILKFYLKTFWNRKQIL